MKRNIITLFYALILGIICSVIPTAVGSYTAPFRQANEKAEKIRNILQVLEIPYEKNMTSQELVALYNVKVSQKNHGKMPVYVSGNSADTTQTQYIAIPFEGPGIWGKIKGFIALESDFKTIRGITFYQQEETPGLGGEINTQAFRSKFKGKTIIGTTGEKGFFIRRSGAKNTNEIDGISGATLTCGKVELMLNTLIQQIAKEAGNEQ
jgi:Na+-transporting NADH:ubiquinone oxidoreductase subunit C